jgi:trk system potassium uptake protein TrkH
LTLFRWPAIGKLCGYITAATSLSVVFPYLASSPFAALSGAILVIGIAFALADFRIENLAGKKNDHLERCRQRARWAAIALPVPVLVNIILVPPLTRYPEYIIAASSIIVLLLIGHWGYEKRSILHLLFAIAGLSTIALVLIFAVTTAIPGLALIIALLSLAVLPRAGVRFDARQNWWELLLNHPARLLLTTFLLLSIFGTLLLLLPVAPTSGTIDLVDAAFTSVSAVCVTGLIVLDTPNDFTMAGQFFILVLIQLGGLGIMTITTVALHAMGRRLSLKQERILTSMTDTDHRDLVKSLATIVKFTFIGEATGAVLLTILFYFTGDSPGESVWRGVFTALSAFCNAGFALQSDSLIPYQANPFILHVVGTLIILGGLAPATSLIIPRWLSGKQTPIQARLALQTTAILLVAGAFFFLASEWNGVLARLSFNDKIHNAWFQSLTLRTAGFNSVDIAGVASPSFLVMLCLMFIGGSPGGTAGGIKTTTFSILAITFWTNITNRSDIATCHRRIRSSTIYRAITIIAAGMIFWIIIVLMLETTQPIPARDLIFEATSALGTVGLSTGATLLLDEIGKIVIMIAMFVGRIGPMTLFMLLSSDYATTASRYPDAKISLT